MYKYSEFDWYKYYSFDKYNAVSFSVCILPVGISFLASESEL